MRYIAVHARAVSSLLSNFSHECSLSLCVVVRAFPNCRAFARGECPKKWHLPLEVCSVACECRRAALSHDHDR